MQFLSRLMGQASRFLVLVTILLTPWSFGGIAPRETLSLIMIAILCSILLWIGSLLTGDREYVRPNTMIWVLIASLALGVTQLIPLPDFVSELTFNGSYKLKQSLRPDEIDKESFEEFVEDPSYFEPQSQISVHAPSTRYDLALLVLALAVFVLGCRFFSHQKHIKLLSVAIAINGVLLSLFGVIQQFTWNGKLYWTVVLSHGGMPFGPYVNRNNAGGYLNLCLAGALALVIWAFTREQEDREMRYPGQGETLESLFNDSWKTKFLKFVANIDASHLGAIILTVPIIAGVLCTLSRGAFLGMLVGLGATCCLLVFIYRKGVASFVLGLGILLSFFFLGYLGRTDTVQERLQTILNQKQENPRIAHWEDAWLASKDFFPLGSGIGTYQFAFKHRETELVDTWYTHAENQYVEAFVEGGPIGVFLLLAAIFLFFRAMYRIFKKSPPKRSMVVLMLGTFAITSQCVTSLFDFGLYLPANMLLLALITGGVIGRSVLFQGLPISAQTEIKPFEGQFVPLSPEEVAKRKASHRLLRWWIPISLFVLVGLSLYESSQFWPIRPFYVSFSKMDEVEEVRTKREELLSELSSCPDDGFLHQQIADSYIREFILRNMEEVRSSLEEPVSEEEVRWRAHPRFMHGLIHQHIRYHRTEEIQKIRSSKLVKDLLRPAISHLFAVQHYSPLYPRPYSKIAEIGLLITDWPNEKVYLEKAKFAAPGDAGMFFRIGVLEANAGRIDDALQSWKASLEISPTYLGPIIRHVEYADILLLQVVNDVLPKNNLETLAVAGGMYLKRRNERTVVYILDQIETILQDESRWPANARTNYSIAQLYQNTQNNSRAIIFLEKALESNPKVVAWRLELSKLYESVKDFDKAVIQIHMCRHDSSIKQERFDQLIEEIRTREKEHKKTISVTPDLGDKSSKIDE